MRVYRYRGFTVNGRAVDTRIAATDLESLRRKLAEDGITVIDVREVRKGGRSLLSRGVKIDELIEFSQNMASLLAAAIPLLQAIDDLREQSESKRWRSLLADLHLRISGGASVSEALRDHPEVFDDLFVSLVSAGEESGRLEHGFQKVSEYLEWSKSTREQLKRAMTYPTLVLSAVSGLIVLLTFFVFPRLTGVFESLDVELPLPTRIMLGVGNFGREWWPVALVVIVTLAIGLPYVGRTPWGRRLFDTFRLRMPVMGRLTRLAIYARFATTMGALLDSGIPLERALTLAERGIGNRLMEDSVRRTRLGVCSGETLSDALTKAGRFTKKLIRMVTIGENTGDLPGMFRLLATQYEREMPGAIRKVTGVIGPTALLMLAVSVGTAAMGIFMPLLKITSAIK